MWTDNHKAFLFLIEIKLNAVQELLYLLQER
jgi:hypothetical protein